MNFVEPIRDSRTVQSMEEYLKKTNLRNYIMFITGIYSGLRISDVLKLRVKDVKNRSNICIREKKTGKQKLFEINPKLKRELAAYVQGKSMNEYLIKSRQGINRPITRNQAYLILRNLADLFSLEQIGCHTLRKTFGYFFYLQYKDIVTLQKIFNHSHPVITLRYIGIEQQQINKAIKNFKIF